MLDVCEIFVSVQGESTSAGRVCAFVRLAGCNLRCVWCDTAYSYSPGAGTPMSVDDVVGKIENFSVKLVEITGGEPLLQADTVALCEELLRRGYEVIIETNGSLDIGVIPKGVRRIVDVKCPDSRSGGNFFVDNIKRLDKNDEVKFVVASINDACWAKGFCDLHNIPGKCATIFSPVSSSLPYDKLADWMVENRLADIRLGLQLHKIIWDDKQGV
jgi:7-carboxy-7-deazaguanine synthase